MSKEKPAVKAQAVTPSDTVANVFRSLYVGGEGDLNLLLRDDTEPVLHVGVLAGTIFTVETLRVYATGTTATNIVGWR